VYFWVPGWFRGAAFAWLLRWFLLWLLVLCLWPLLLRWPGAARHGAADSVRVPRRPAAGSSL